MDDDARALAGDGESSHTAAAAAEIDDSLYSRQRYVLVSELH